MDTPMDATFVSLAVIAVVKLVDLVKDQDYASSLKIVLAACVGAIIGYYKVHGLDVVSGIQAGLAASGLVSLFKITKGNG